MADILWAHYDITDVFYPLTDTTRAWLQHHGRKAYYSLHRGEERLGYPVSKGGAPAMAERLREKGFTIDED